MAYPTPALTPPTPQGLDTEVFAVANVKGNSKPVSKRNEADFLATARARFKQAIDATSLSRQSELDDLRFAAGSPDNGFQWPDQIRNARISDTNGARPCLTINKLPQHIRQVTNDQRQNRPSIKVIPVDDESDVEVAEVFNGIIRHIEVNSDADVAYDTACENQVTIGEGYFRVLTDYCDEMSFDQDLKIERIRNSFSVYMDPLIQDPCGSDQQWCFISDSIPMTEFERLYPKAQAANFDQQGMGDDVLQWIMEDTVRVAEYFCFENVEKKLYLWSNGEITLEGDPIPLGVMVGEKPVKERTTTLKKVVWTVINGVEILKEREWLGTYIPVIRVVGNEYDYEGRIIVSGIVRNAKDAQRMYNYWTSQEAELLALAPKAPFIMAAGQVEGFEDKWANANTTNYAYLEYNPLSEEGTIVPPPQRVQPPMPSAGILQAKMGAADDIKSTTGQYNASLGQQSNETSGKAIMARQTESDVGTFHYIDNLSRAIRQCGRVLIDLIPKIYNTRRVARIIGEDGQTDRVVIDPQQEAPFQEIEQDDAIVKIYNPSIGKYDVTVIVGPGFNSRRQEALEAMSMLVQSNPQLWQVIGDLLVKNMDWPGAAEMSDRIKRTIPPEIVGNGDDNPELNQAMKVIEQLKQEGMQMRSIIDNIHKSIEYQKAENDKLKAESTAYNAETDRMKALQPGMTPDQVQALILTTMQSLITSPDLSTIEAMDEGAMANLRANMQAMQQPQPTPEGAM
jgi:hypothetical protein